MLRQSEWKYRLVADNTYDWEFWIDPQGRFAYCSPSCQRISGYSPDKCLADASLLQRIIHSDDRALYSGHVLDDHSVSESEEIRFRIIRPDDTERRPIEGSRLPAVPNADSQARLYLNQKVDSSENRIAPPVRVGCKTHMICYNFPAPHSNLRSRELRAASRRSRALHVDRETASCRPQLTGALGCPILILPLSRKCDSPRQEDLSYGEEENSFTGRTEGRTGKEDLSRVPDGNCRQKNGLPALSLQICGEARAGQTLGQPLQRIYPA